MFSHQVAQCSDRYVGGRGRVHLDIGKAVHLQPGAGLGWVDVQVTLVGGVVGGAGERQGGLDGGWEERIRCLKLGGERGVIQSY